jgi:ABC-type branched-subunit amino acid transport system ATPase component
MSLLEVRGLTRRFGGVAALDGCDFTVEEGTITGLIGPNGSGKTTAFNVITGYVRADSGVLLLDGRPVGRPTPGGMYRHGVIRTFQRARVFGGLTPVENLVAAARQPWWSLVTPRVRRGEAARATELLGALGLGAVLGLQAGRLSYGQRKLVEFAAVLMGEPRLVLLDEPAAGVTASIVETMERHIREQHERGVTFLVVEHDMDVVARLCDPLIVMDRGRAIACGPPELIRADPAVLDAYLGA